MVGSMVPSSTLAAGVEMPNRAAESKARTTADAVHGVRLDLNRWSATTARKFPNGCSMADRLPWFTAGRHRARSCGAAPRRRLGTAVLAFSLGALHALTPGHGKAALAAYFLGQEARVAKGLRVALSAALLHVLSGFAVFLALRFLVGQSPNFLGRGSPGFTAIGYCLIILAGAIMLVQSLRPRSGHDGAHALTAGVGLLPCPLTISVLGFAWAQSSAPWSGSCWRRWRSAFR